MSCQPQKLVPFHFDTHQVRAFLDARGEPWVVAADVLAVLELDRKALERLEDDEKGVNSIHTPGGEQEMTVVNESGVYELVWGSRKPEAKRFKRWVKREVLPSIRKTGTYTVPGKEPQQPPAPLSAPPLPGSIDDKVSALLRIADRVAQVPGVKEGIAVAAGLNAINVATGLPTESYRLALPAAQGPLSSFNATQLGERLGLSATTANKRLEQLGLQWRNPRRKWELTETGKEYGEAFPFTRHGHADYQVLWKEAVLELLREPPQKPI